MRASARDDGDGSGGVDFADDVAGGFGQVEIALSVEDDGGGEDEGDGGCGDGCLWLCAEGEEQEDEDYPKRSEGVAMGCGALRTHGIG